MFLEGNKILYKYPIKNPQHKKEKNNCFFDPRKKVFRKAKCVIESFPSFIDGRHERKNYTYSSIYKIREDN